MKKVAFFALMVFVIPALVYASPRLICDPQDGVAKYDVEYKIETTGQIILTEDIPAQPDGSLNWDLVNLSIPGNKYSFRARAKDATGWPSDWTPFTAPAGKPDTPGNVKIVP